MQRLTAEYFGAVERQPDGGTVAIDSTEPDRVVVRAMPDLPGAEKTEIGR
ncbi:hypothetical protein [Aurantimonas sp. A3-2-R12]|nr:hypothetical protein [Aurantimonas sp. A3-2-R12]